MGKILMFVLLMLLLGIVWSFPLYACVNLVLWLFNIPFHLTIFQAIAVCLLLSVIRGLLFENRGD